MYSDVNALLLTTIGGNTVEDYLRSVLIFLVSYLGLWLVYKVLLRNLSRIAKQTAMDLDDFVVSLLSHLGRSFFIVIALYFSMSFLNLPGVVHTLLRALVVIVFTFRVTALIQEALRYGLKYVYLRKTKVKDDPAAETAVNGLVGFLRWAIWLIALLFLLDNLGFNVNTMIASIGITGIAVGMASQAILGDMFSGFAIFLDKPFQVGDFIIIDNYMGTVEHIGIKTTRIRSLFGEQLVFANSDLTKSRIKNYKRLEEPRGSCNFTLAYDMPASKLREARGVIINAVQSAPDVRLDHVHLMRFGASGYEFEAAFYVLKGNVSRNFDIQQEVYFRIAESLQNAGIIPSAQARDILIKNKYTKENI